MVQCFTFTLVALHRAVLSILSQSVNTFLPCVWPWVLPVAGNGHVARLLPRAIWLARILYMAMSTWPDGNGHVTFCII